MNFVIILALCISLCGELKVFGQLGWVTLC